MGKGENGLLSAIVVMVAATVGDAGVEPEDVEDGDGSKVETEISTALAGASDSSSWHPASNPAKKRQPDNARTSKKIVSISPD